MTFRPGEVGAGVGGALAAAPFCLECAAAFPLGAGGGRADRNEGRRSKQHHELARSREFWGHRILVIVSPFGLADRQIGLALIVAAAGSSSLGQLRHTGPE